MAFIITDSNNRYINKQGDIVYNEEDARRWSSKTKALNWLQNNLPSSAKSYNFRVKDTTVTEEFQELDEIVALEDIDKFKSYLNNLYSTRVNQARINFLNDSIQKLDLEITDIQHAIEFNKVNVVEGYNYYKMLHDVLVQRREYKDELQKINIIRGTLSEAMVDTMIRSLDGVDTQQYEPRILGELFQ